MPKPIVVAYGLRPPERAAAATVADLIEPADDAAFADAVFDHPRALVLYGVDTFGRICTRQFAPIDGIPDRSVLVVWEMAGRELTETEYGLFRDVIAVFTSRVSVVLDLAHEQALAYLSSAATARDLGAVGVDG